MMDVESEAEFAALAANGNGILQNFPNHAMITPQVFFLAREARSVLSKEVAFLVLIKVISPADDNDPELEKQKEREVRWAEWFLAMCWASSKNMLTPIKLTDVPEDNVMSHAIRGIKEKIRSGRVPETVSPEREGTNRHMELFAASSKSPITILSKMQEGKELDQSKKEAEKSILKAMGPTQRKLFLTLCTADMGKTPKMSAFMTNLTSCKTPQKAISLIQSEARGWEGTFSVGGMHKLLSNGFLSQEANRANPGGFSLFMFHPRTVERDGKGRNELLREYLGMDVDEATLKYYAKQGYFFPTNPHDLRVQLQAALAMLELLTCPKSIATQGLDYVLEPPRWTRMMTIYNDRFKTEKDFGTKFCYTLDRALQIFFDRATRWGDVATDGEPDYLRRKVEVLIDRIEDGCALTVILPAILITSNGTTATKKREAPTTATPTDSKTKISKKTATASTDTEANAHINDDAQPEWLVPTGKSYNAIFGAQMAGIKGWPYFNDNRLAKQGRLSRAPMCVRFQALGDCTQGCTLAHMLRASDMPATDREAVVNWFLVELYS
jgi:hypothetical protein